MAYAEEKHKSFSFGFSKKKEASKLVESAIKDEHKDDSEQTEYVTSLEDKALNSTKPKEEAKLLVIPLIEKNKWHVPTPAEIEQSDQSACPKTDDVVPELVVPATGDDITDRAVQELVSDARRQQSDWDERGDTKDPNRQIPLLMQNKVPEGTETDERLDVSIRPDEPVTANYDEVPIEEYGMALLRGMGFKDGQGIGKNNQSVAPVVAVARPKGLGLGADRSLTLQQKDGERSAGKNPDHDESLVMKKGGFCVILGGKHEGLYATVEGLDEDNARVVVKLAIGSSIVTLNQMAVKLVPRKEFDKNSKYLNKTKVEKFKEEESRKNSKDRSSSREKDSNRDPDRHRDRHTDRDRHANRDRHSDTDRHSNSHRSRDKHETRKSHHSDKHRSEEDHHRKRKGHYRDSDSGSDSKDPDGHHRTRKGRHQLSDQSRSRSRSPLSDHSPKKKFHDRGPSLQPENRAISSWLRPHLRVRIIDQKYKKGKYYKSKVVIEDVISLDTCICESDEGKVLEGLGQSQLETVIPKAKLSHVMVVSGKHKGKIGQILERDSSSCKAIVQVLPDCDEVLALDYDVICEYTGNIQDLY